MTGRRWRKPAGKRSGTGAGGGWRSVVLVTTPDQDTRSRIRFGRCFAGRISVVTTTLPAYQWPYQIAYQWAATFRALVLQRSC
jgi:hypothetical protein